MLRPKRTPALEAHPVPSETEEDTRAEGDRSAGHRYGAAGAWRWHTATNVMAEGRVRALMGQREGTGPWRPWAKCSRALAPESEDGWGG